MADKFLFMLKIMKANQELLADIENIRAKHNTEIKQISKWVIITTLIYVIILSTVVVWCLR